MTGSNRRYASWLLRKYGRKAVLVDSERKGVIFIGKIRKIWRRRKQVYDEKFRKVLMTTCGGGNRPLFLSWSGPSCGPRSGVAPSCALLHPSLGDGLPVKEHSEDPAREELGQEASLKQRRRMEKVST